LEYEDKAVGVVTDTVNQVTCGLCGCEIDTEGLEPFVRVECPDCGSLEVVPARLGPFLLINLIGKGGMGGVYLAMDETLGRRVAVKVMLKSLGTDPKFLATFKREAQAIAKLNHPNIAQIYSFGQTKGQPYIVMELVSGKRLDKMIDENHRLDPCYVMKIGLQIAEGLNAADEAGLIHGDIKPENILVDEKGRAKLVDFGIATVAHSSQQEGIWGTPYYIAPEKVKRQKVDSRADIYSLGGTLYHAITGIPPFEGKTPVEVVKARLEHPPTPIRKIAPMVDECSEQIVLRMLEQNPMKRYPTYASLLSDMRKQIEVPNARAPNKTGKLVRTGANKSTTAGGADPAAGVIRPTGKIRIVKKTTTASVTGPRKTQVLTRSTARPKSTRMASARPKSSKRLTTVGRPHSTRLTAIQQPKKESSKAGLWAFLVTLLLAGIAAGLFFFLQERERKQNERREALELKDARREANKLYDNIKTTVTNITMMADSVADFPTGASNAVQAVTGEPFQYSPNIKTAGKSENEEPSATKPAEPVPEVAPTAVQRNDGAPAGIRSPEDLAKSRSERNRAKPKKDRGKTAALLPEEEEAAQEIVLLAKTMITKVARIQAQAIAVQLFYENDVKKRAREAINATTSVDCKERAMILLDLKAQVAEQHDSIADLTKEAKEHRDEIQTIKSEVLTAREQREASRLEALKKEQEEKLRKEELAQMAVLRKKEIARTEAAEKTARQFLLDNDYDSAIREMERTIADITTEPAIRACELAKERYQRMKSLKEFLVRMISDYPLSCGWYDARRNADVDVLGADDEGLTIRSIEEPVPWSNVGLQRMVKFIEHYLSPQNWNKIPIRDLAEQNVNAAIFISVHAEDIPRAKEMITIFRNAANMKAIAAQKDEIAEILDRLILSEDDGS
jgi:serine/threonine protein kinase